MEDTSTYNVNGKLYAIPSSKQESFLEDMPEAKQVYVFENQGKKLGIPKDQEHDFMSHVPDAKMSYDNPELRPAPKENQSAVSKPVAQLISNQPAVSKPVAQLISNQPAEAELNAKGEWNESTPKPEHINFTDHPLDATKQFAKDIWGSAKQGGKEASNAIETGGQELGRYAAKLAGWMDSDNPKSVADSKKIEDHIQQNIGQLKADKAGIEQYTPMYKSAGYIGGAAPYMAAVMVALATGSAEVDLASKAAFTLLGVGEGAQAYDKYTALNGKKTDEPTKALTELLYGALYTAPIAELGKYMHTKWVGKLIGIDLLKNPEIEKTAGKVAFETFAKDQPTLAQRFLKPEVKGLAGSIAGMETMMLGTEAVKRNLIGDTSGEESYGDIAIRAALTAIGFHLSVSPFGVMRQDAYTQKRWDEAESIGITLNHKGKPVEVLPTEEGKEQKGRRPDGSIISVTPEMARNTFIIPGDVFRSEMQKVKSTGEASPGIERDAYSGRVTKMVNKLSDKNGNIHVATDGYGNNYYVTHQDENGDLHGVDTNGKQGIIDPELKIQTVNKGEVWKGLMNNYDQVKTPKEKQPEVQALPAGPPAPTPSQQAETEARSFHKEHADRSSLWNSLRKQESQNKINNISGIGQQLQKSATDSGVRNDNSITHQQVKINSKYGNRKTERRATKDGKVAIYDSVTKDFIGYE